MFACKLTSKGLQTDPFRSTSFRVGLLQRMSLFLSNFIDRLQILVVNFQRLQLLQIAHHMRNGWLSLMGVDACAVEPERRFVTEGGEKKKKAKI